MTKDEVLMLVEENCYYRITTDTDTVKGKVLKGADTALLILKSDKKKKLVEYIRIREIDELDEAETLEQPSNIFPASSAAKNPTAESKKYFEEPAAKSESIIRVNIIPDSIRDRIQASHRAIYQDIFRYNFDKDSLKKTFKENRTIQGQWAPLFSMFNDSIKNHAFAEKYSKLKRECDGLISKYPDFAPLYAFKGHILYEHGDLLEAAKNFEAGCDFYNAIAVFQIFSEDERVLYSLLKLCLTVTDSLVLKNTFYYAGLLHKGMGVCSLLKNRPELMNEEISIHGLYFLIDSYNLAGQFSWSDVMDSGTLLSQLMEKLKSETPVTGNAVEPLTINATDEIKKGNPVFKGEIASFGTLDTQRYGFIDKKIYFHIEQVEDYVLRKLLLDGKGLKTKVTYTLGINHRGDKAADHIKPVEELRDEDSQELWRNQVYDGYISSYNKGWIDHFGKEIAYGSGQVCRKTDNKIFSFHPDYLEIDPKLQKKIDEAYKVEEMDVTFSLKKSGGKLVVASLGLPGYKHLYPERSFLHEDKFSIPEYVELLPYKENKSEPEVKSEFPKNDETKTVSVSISSNDIFDKIRPYFYPPMSPNPFLNLSDLNEVGNFQKGNRWMTGIKQLNGEIINRDDLEAERCFIRAIRSSDNLEASIANLITIYLRLNDEEYIIKGLKLLEVYGSYIPRERLLDLHYSLLDKSGKTEPLCIFLAYLVEQTIKPNKLLNYMARLAGSYQRNHDYQNSYKWYEKTLDYLEKNSFIFKKDDVSFNNMRFYHIRGMIKTSFLMDQRDLSQTLARKLLKECPTDEIALNVAKGDFSILYQDKTTTSDETNGLALTVGNELSEYESFLLSKVNLTEMTSRFRRIYPKISENRYTAGSSEAKRDIEDIQQKMGGNIAIKVSDRSEYMLGIAKICLDSRENEKLEEKKYSLDYIKNFLGRCLFYRGDYAVQSYKETDTIRFYYIEALKDLASETDSLTVTNAINRLVYTFFIETVKLEEEIRQSVRYPREYVEKYFSSSCVSIKDFLIMFAMLQDKQDYVEKIRKKVYENQVLKDSLIKWCREFDKISFDIKDSFDEYEFEHLLRQVQKAYNNHIENIRRVIDACTYEYNMPEKLNQNLNHLRAYIYTDFTTNLDKRYLQDLLTILDLYSRTQDRRVQMEVDDMAERYQDIHNRLQQFIKEIEKSPTALSFNYIRSCAESFITITLDSINQLYSSSCPEIDEICLLNDSVYVDNNTVRLAISFSNRKFKQAADGVDITLSTEDEGAVQLLQTQKTFTTLHSGEKEEYIAIFSLADQVIQEGQFSIEVKLTYQYRINYQQSASDTRIEKLNINLNSKDSFEHIENKYEKIYRSSSVTIPEMFKGRDQLIDSICKSMDLGNGIMNKNRGIILWGQKRVGKNSVKDYLKKAIQDTYHDAYIPVELGSMGNCGSLKGILITIINQTQLTLMRTNSHLFTKYVEAGLLNYGRNLDHAEEYMAEFTNYMNILSYVIRENSEPEKNILLYYFDEFSYLYEWIGKKMLDGQVFMRFWKSFIQDYGICAIIIAQDVIPTWKSQYENEFACMNYDNEITYLAPDGARELICDPCPLNGESRFSPEAVNYIYSLTKGSAFLIVILCKAIIDYMNTTYTEKVTKSIVEIVLDKEFIEKKGIFERDDFEPQIVDPSKVDDGDKYRTLNTRILKEISESTANMTKIEIEKLDIFKNDLTGEAHEALRRLSERRIIDLEGDRYCSISMPLLKFYFLREAGTLQSTQLSNI